MKIRRIEGEECRRTCSLWEEVFPEDAPEFLEYYYTEKTKDNDIYIIEEEQEICAMLHINPYDLYIGGKILQGHYIVAVATKEKHRHKKYMSSLLKRSEEDMRKAKEPFTFLMPAAEAIYSPHGYRFIYDQDQGEIEGEKPGGSYQFFFAGPKDFEEMSKFSNQILKERKDVFALRSPYYYERLRKERKSEEGGIVMVRKDKMLVGMFSYIYMKQEGYEIAEPLFLKEEEAAFKEAVFWLTKGEKAFCSGYGTEKKPMIMAKILDVKSMMECLETKEKINLFLTVMEETGQEEIGTYHISGERTLYVEPLKEKKTVQSIGIGDLTSIIFGYKKPEETAISKELRNELLKIKPFSEVFLNEVV